MTYTTQSMNGRTFDINQPVNATSAMIFLHGVKGNSNTVATQLGNPDPDNYYMVFPNGREYNGNPNELRWYDDGGLKALQDIGYIAQIIEHLELLGVTDIYIGGHSQGASAASMIIALYPQYFKGLLLVSNYLHNNITVKPNDKPMIHLHGSKDIVVYPDGVNYSVAKNMNKFIDAGYKTECEILPVDHSLSNLNLYGDVMDRVEYLVSSAWDI